MVLISYSREYYSNGELRVTIDKDIQYSLTSNEVIKVTDDQYVFEIKTSINTDLAEIANKFCFPCSRFSKYERCLEHFRNNMFVKF